jgi:hypothetical protein
MVQLSATKCSCIASEFSRHNPIASERVFIGIVYFVIDSVRKLLVTPSYIEIRTQTARQEREVNEF